MSYGLKLCEVKPGTIVRITDISGGAGVLAKLRDMGLKKNSVVRVIHSSRSGPCVVMFGKTRLVIGRGMSEKINIEEGGSGV